MQIHLKRLGAAAIALIALSAQMANAQSAEEVQVEAFAGDPLGVGKITVLSATGLTRRMSISDRENRVLYPAYDEITAQGEAVTDHKALRSLTAYFLFRGDQPLELTLERWTSYRGDNVLSLAGLEPPVHFDAPRTAQAVPEKDAARHSALLKEWWRAHSDMVLSSAAADAYPLQVENFVSVMLSRRLKLSPPYLVPRNPGFDIDIFGILLGVESVRLAMQRETLLTQSSEPEKADLALPAATTQPAIEVPNVPGDVEIEPIARHVPAECFYVRWGNLANIRWLRATLDTWGRNLRDLVALRGMDYEAWGRLERQLGLRATDLGGAIIEDVALLGTDTFFREGAAVGLLFQARDNAALSAAIRAQRAGIMKSRQATPGETASEQTIEIAGHRVSLIETSDNSVRSFYAVDGDFHLVTTSQTIVRRFFEAGKGTDALGGLKEFRYARTLMPVARKDAFFVYLSDPWFRLLISPQYRVEMTRRMRAEGEIELVHLARLAARAEGQPGETIEQLVAGGFLPESFGLRPDGSRAVVRGEAVVDSLRGARRSFLPVPDVVMAGITPSETRAYASFSGKYRALWQRIDPVIVGIRREYLDTPQGRREKVVLDVHISPYVRRHYDVLEQWLAEPDGKRIAPVTGNIVETDVRLKEGFLGQRGAPFDRLFAGVRDFQMPFDFRDGRVVPHGIDLLNFPAYFGQTPATADWWFLGGGDAPEGYSEGGPFWGPWRRRFGDFLVAGSKGILEVVTPQIKVEEARRPAQLRLRIADLAPTQIAAILNAYGYERARTASAGNAYFMHVLRQQLRVPLAKCADTMQEVLAVKPVCPLGGRYEFGRGHSWWISTAWPEEFIAAENRIPAGYESPFLKWFHGLDLEFSIDSKTLTTHLELDLAP